MLLASLIVNVDLRAKSPRGEDASGNCGEMLMHGAALDPEDELNPGEALHHLLLNYDMIKRQHVCLLHRFRHELERVRSTRLLGLRRSAVSRQFQDF